MSDFPSPNYLTELKKLFDTIRNDLVTIVANKGLKPEDVKSGFKALDYEEDQLKEFLKAITNEKNSYGQEAIDRLFDFLTTEYDLFLDQQNGGI